jgi:ribokinase
MVVCTLGDLVLEVVVRFEQPLAEGDDSRAAITVGVGGQAANVAAWAAKLGVRARYLGVRGRDSAGRLLESELRARGVDMCGPRRGANGVVVSLVSPDGERSMASDRRSSSDFPPLQMDPAWLIGCDWLHVSGYSLTEGELLATAEIAAATVHDAGGRVGVDASSWTLIEDLGAERFGERVRSLRPEVLFATEREFETLGSVRLAETVIVKRGARGCTVIADGPHEHYDAVPAEQIDATGAGDAFAAGYLVGGIELALEAGACCVSQIGAMPTVDLEPAAFQREEISP